jgi:hypothetical protein
METVKGQLTSIKTNWIGAAIGGVGAYYLAKRFGNVENNYVLGAIAVGGAILGAMGQAKMGAKAPTAATVTAE